MPQPAMTVPSTSTNEQRGPTASRIEPANPTTDDIPTPSVRDLQMEAIGDVRAVAADESDPARRAEILALADRAEAALTPVALIEEAALSPGIWMMCKRYGDRLNVTWDPSQIDSATRDAMLHVHAGEYTEARVISESGPVRTVIADLPADELPVRVEQHGDGRCTITWDDSRITAEEMLQVLDMAAAKQKAGE